MLQYFHSALLTLITLWGTLRRLFLVRHKGAGGTSKRPQSLILLGDHDAILTREQLDEVVAVLHREGISIIYMFCNPSYAKKIKAALHPVDGEARLASNPVQIVSSGHEAPTCPHLQLVFLTDDQCDRLAEHVQTRKILPSEPSIDLLVSTQKEFDLAGLPPLRIAFTQFRYRCCCEELIVLYIYMYNH